LPVRIGCKTHKFLQPLRFAASQTSERNPVPAQRSDSFPGTPCLPTQKESAMQQQLKQRFDRVEKAIGEASQACSAERNLPGELRDCILKLDRQADRVRHAGAELEGAALCRMVEELAVLGERARRVCVNVPTLTAQMKSAVLHVQEELLELKRDVH
jgi:hypothetical protein